MTINNEHLWCSYRAYGVVQLWLQLVFKKILSLTCILRVTRELARDTPRNARSLHVMCPLSLSNFNKNRNETNSSNARQYQVSWKSVQWFWSCFLHAGRQAEAEGRMFATISCECEKNRYSENKWQHVKNSCMKEERYHGSNDLTKEQQHRWVD